MGRRRRVDRFVPAGCLLAILTATARGGGDVPLELWSSSAWPSGLDFGDTNGIAFGDFDADGWIDVFVPQAALLWRNVNGTDWVLASDLSDVLTMPALRFGASFADWNEDGLPDVATEGRNVCTPFQPCPFDECSHLLLNMGDGQFEDVSTAIVDTSLCNLQAETFCWGDVDGDLDLDLFMPAYAPGVLDSPGNFFLENLGPGELGVYRFTEAAIEVGVRNDISMPRPEGAQFADVDLDGDLDLFSNAILYQNVSTLGSPQFAAMEQGASGIVLDLKDQGVAFFDYDLDGDYDLAAIYPEAGAIIWENAGDGTFFYPGLIVEDPFQGLDVGLSTADWDNDGDIDYTTQQVFRRNMLIETGQRFFETAPTSIPLAHRMFATPAWGDWDKDGDLDCALGNWSEVGRFYDNVLYSDATDPSARRSLRIRCVRDSDGAPGGTETEFGASVEIDIVGDPIRRRRKAFVASGHGYLNQSEYTLHFGLPADPVPADPNEDLRFDIIADFPSLPSQGPWRVDKHVNKALGDLNLAELAEREITIFRSGRVVVDGTNVKPSGRTPRLTVAGGSLAVADPLTGIAPIRAVDGETWAGVAFDTRGAHRRVLIKEIVVDGALATGCPESTGNILLWDVTDPATPCVVLELDGGTVSSVRNRRLRFTVDVPLELGRQYRLVANVVLLRTTPFAGPIAHDDLTMQGGLLLVDRSPCTGFAVAAAAVDRTQRAVTIVFGLAGAGADIDGDHLVGLTDLTLLLAAWGTCSKCPEDLDGDGEVGVTDLTELLEEWSGSRVVRTAG